MAKQLHNEIFQYRSNTFSETTKTTYRTHRNSYLRFCQHMGYPPVPAQPAHICQYAAFLARTLKATSIPNYLNIISILHKEFNLPNPLANNWALQSLLTGIKRVKGQPPAQKLPIAPDVLKKIYFQLNLRNSFDASFWAVCLVSFYGMLRKRHLLAGSHSTFDPSQQLVRSDFQIFPWGALVTIRWSKTIQFRERVVQIPLPLIPDSPLCPVIAIQRAFSLVPNVPPTPKPSCGKTLLPSASRFLLILSFCNAFGVPSMLLVCQLEIMLATPFGGVAHPLPFGQDYQSSSLRFLGTGILTLFCFTLRFHSLSD